MAFLSEAEARTLGRNATLGKTATSILLDGVKSERNHFDIFLSHSRLDAEVVLGVKRKLELLGHTVYVDWVDDPQLDRQSVTPATAQRLRVRMHQSQSLFYAHSPASTTSRWMPWELGYFDGLRGNVAVLPILSSSSGTFKGEEYLGLYPYVDVAGSTLFVNRNTGDYQTFSYWLASPDKMRSR